MLVNILHESQYQSCSCVAIGTDSASARWFGSHKDYEDSFVVSICITKNEKSGWPSMRAEFLMQILTHIEWNFEWVLLHLFRWLGEGFGDILLTLYPLYRWHFRDLFCFIIKVNEWWDQLEINVLKNIQNHVHLTSNLESNSNWK